ncbi:MAG: 5'-methylthioadenosine/adenosylhomocysteine nucleosidase [Candidatus Izemoplasmatales bacterium]|jgi:adenosylhomocysteine nucleosidase|nr:5'-methylthioadenosine/adenosylhomocysteine nucleosidase [Candidatus Izemoplasmatales bacterium]
MIGIIGAIDYELNHFFTNMIIARTEIIADKTFYVGKIGHHNVVIVKSGIGKVNAAMTATILINTFDVRLIINTGVAGGLEPVNIGDIILAEGIAYFDVSLTEIDDVPYGQMGSDPLLVRTNDQYLAKGKKVFDKLGYSYVVGNLVSGDKFVTKKRDLAKISKQVPNIIGVEMEGMAIAITAYKFNRPFISIRGISDIIESVDQPKNYRDVVKQVATKTTQFVLDFLEVVDE